MSGGGEIMSNVDVLTVGHLTYEQARRLVEELREAHAGGADLGSRLPHIHAAAGTFRKLAADLRLAVDRLIADASAEDRVDIHAVAALRKYVEGIEQLAELAANFPGLDQARAAGDQPGLRVDPFGACAGSTAGR